MSHPNHCLVKHGLFLVILIELMLTKSSDKEVQKNRNKLKPIIYTVILLERLGLPFRGHRDDSQYHPNVGEYSSGGVGNFIECLG